MDIRKTLAGASAALIAFSQIAVGVAAAATFQDVPSDHWSYSYVEQLVADGVIDAADNYRPNDTLNRAELVKIALKAADIEIDSEGAPTFSDVASDAWYYPYVATAAKAGIVGGYTDADGKATGKFGPSDPVTRAAATKILIEAFEVPFDSEPDSTFSDVEESAWYYVYVVTAYNQSIVDGYSNGKFGPADFVTRAQVAKLAVNSANPVERVVEEGDDDDTVSTSDGSLEVELSSDTPEGGTVPQDAIVDMVAYDFTAAEDDVVLSSLTVKRSGIGDDADLASFVLRDGDGTRISKTKTFNSDDEATFTLLGGGLTIEAGDTVTIVVSGQMGGTTAENSQHKIVLEEAGIDANTTDIDGDFALTGETFTVGSQAAGELTISTSGTPANVKIGQTASDIARFKAENTGDEDVYFTGITLKQEGDADLDQAISNVKLDLGSTMVAEGVISGDYVSFQFDDPIEIKDGGNERFDVSADIIGEATKTIELVLDNTVDVTGEGKTYGFGISAVNSYDVSLTTPITIEAGAVAIVKTEPADTFRRDKDNVVIGGFDVKLNAGKDLEMTAFNVDIVISGTAVPGTYNDTGDILENVELFDATNKRTYDLSVVANAADTSETYYDRDLGVILKNGETRSFQVRADTTDFDMSNVTIDVSISAIGDSTTTTGIEFKETTDDEYVTDVTPSAISFNSIDGKESSYELSSLSLADVTEVVGTDLVNAFEFKVEESDKVSDLLIRDMTVKIVKDADDDDSDGTLFDEVDGTYLPATSGEISQICLYELGKTEALQCKGGSQLSATGTVLFDSLDLTIAKGTSASYRVRVSLVDDAANSGLLTQVALNDMTVEDEDNDDITFVGVSTSDRIVTLASEGNLYVSNDITKTGFDYDKFALAGSTSDFVAAFKVKSENEDVTIKDLTINVTGVAATSLAKMVSSAQLYGNDRTTLLKETTPSSTAALIDFNGVNATVTGSESYIYLKLDLNPYGKNQTGELDEGDLTFNMVIDDARGFSSGTKLAADTTAGILTGGEIAYDEGNNGTFGEVADTKTGASKQLGVLATQITNVSFVSSYNGVSVDTRLTNGVNNIGIVKVSTAATANNEEDGASIKTYLTQLSVAIDTIDGAAVPAYTTLDQDGATIERIGGTQTAVNATDATSVVDSATSFDGAMVFDTAALTTGTDYQLEPGKDYYFLIKGSISGLNGTDDGAGFLQLKLADLNGSIADVAADGFTLNSVAFKDSIDTTAAWSGLRFQSNSVTDTKISE